MSDLGPRFGEGARLRIRGARASGATTLAYAVARALAEHQRVTLIDLDLERNASRWQLDPGCDRQGRWRAVPSAWKFEVCDLRGLETPLDPRWPGLRVITGPSSYAWTSIECERSLALGPSIELLAGECLAWRLARGRAVPCLGRGPVVRIPGDARSAGRLWEARDLSPALDQDSVFGRAVARAIRVLCGASVGVALGGGGALGFANIGLLRALAEAKIPVDHVSGTSSGSLVAAAYVGGGLEALDALIERRHALVRGLLSSSVSTRPFGRLIESLVGDLRIEQTELGYFPLGLDIESGQRFVLDVGTLAAGLRASSALPGLAPPYEHEGRRIYDAGLVDLVPATTLREGQVDFVIASNVMSAPPGRSTLRPRLESVARGQDWMRGMYLSMAANARAAVAPSDHVFEPELGRFGVYDFARAAQIAAKAHACARAQMGVLAAKREAKGGAHSRSLAGTQEDPRWMTRT